MLRYGAFEAWLQHDDIPIMEFATQQKDNVVKCYIPCNVKLPFQVHWRDNGSKLHTAGYVVVDGVKSSGRFLLGAGQTNRTGYRTGDTTEEPYTFTTEHGSIELRIALVEELKVMPNLDPQTMASMRDQGFSSQGLSYRKIQGLEKFTVPQQRQATLSVSSRSGQPAQSYVTFVWYYRTVSWLQQHGMLQLRPNTPPVPITVHHSRDAPSQHGVEWPDTVVRPPSPKQQTWTQEGVDHISYLCRKYKKEVEEEMCRRYGYESYDLHDPNFKEPKVKYKPRKSKKGKEREVPMEESQTQQTFKKGKEREVPTKQTLVHRSSKNGREREISVEEEVQEAPNETSTSCEIKERAILSPPMNPIELKTKYKAEFEAEMLRRYGPDWENPKVTKRLDVVQKPKRAKSTQSLARKQKSAAVMQEQLANKQGYAAQSRPDNLPADIQKHPRASNTYVLPSPALTSSSSASTPRASSSASTSANHRFQPPPFPYLTPSGRPSAIIDTRFFGYASPAPSNASSSSAQHSGQGTRN